MDKDVIYETENFVVFVPHKPHVDRLDGGHLCIQEKIPQSESRLDLDPSKAKEFMRLSMMIGEAMTRGLKNREIDIAKINYQENGNWAFLDEKTPNFHMHIYGRTKDSKQQKFGEALFFPDPSSVYYDRLNALNDEDINEILNELYKIEKEEKYSVSNW